MIHYHGGPITPLSAAIDLWKRRHGFVSFARPDQIELAAEICQSFALDNGAYSFWKADKGRVDVAKYALWVREWRQHPGFDFAVIPDAIDGTERENDQLIIDWIGQGMAPLDHAIPVWHLHESLERLQKLCCRFLRVAFGSSGEYAEIGSEAWWQRMGLAMDAICDEHGRPRCKLHGLRMLDPTIFSQFPFASADSTNIARNIGIDQAWRGPYPPVTKAARALVLAYRIEHHASAARWTRTFGVQKNFDLVG